MSADTLGWGSDGEAGICRAFIEGVEVLDPLGLPGLQVLPLGGPHYGAEAIALLDDLIEAGAAEVSEVDRTGVVPEILVKNRSRQYALVVDGTELRGAKQNRMVNVTLILNPQSETRIPVSCVERGRWRHRSALFTSAKRTVAGKLRRRKAAMVAEGLRMEKCASTDQGAIWDEVSAYLRESGVRSDTEALDEAFTQHARRLEDVCSRLERVEAHGAIVVINGAIVGMDLFAAPSTFAKVWPNLLRGYAMDAILEQAAERVVTKRQAAEWVRALPVRSVATAHEVPGAGRHVAILGDDLAGGFTSLQGHPVHAAIFALEP